MAGFRLNIRSNLEQIIQRFRGLPEQVDVATITATDDAARIGYRHATALAPRPEAVNVSIENTANGARTIISSEDSVNYWLSEGTGLYGVRGTRYPIEPHPPRKALRWFDREESRFVFAKRVMHPGIRGNNWMERAAENADDEIREAYNRRLEDVL